METATKKSNIVILRYIGEFKILSMKTMYNFKIEKNTKINENVRNRLFFEIPILSNNTNIY